MSAGARHCTVSYREWITECRRKAPFSGRGYKATICGLVSSTFPRPSSLLFVRLCAIRIIKREWPRKSLAARSTGSVWSRRNWRRWSWSAPPQLLGTSTTGWLARCQQYYQQRGKSKPWAELSVELTQLKQMELWLYDFDSQMLQQALADLR